MKQSLSTRGTVAKGLDDGSDPQVESHERNNYHRPVASMD
jgi:hypothetical protein